MAEETITILRVGTDEAVKSVNDLKNNIKVLKENLGELEIGTEEYQDTLDELKVNQNALKDAMYATTASMEDVTKAATGASDTYNGLVHRMAALKEEFRATDDAARRADLGAQIKAINDQLKDMDALQGNFQRNVGNYAGSIKDVFRDMSVNVDAFRKSLKVTGGSLNDFKDGLEGISKSPMIATFGILVSVAIKLADTLKDNETAMAGLRKAMAALQPVMDFFSAIIEKLAGLLADLVTKVTDFVSSNGLIQKVITGVMGVGNAILQYVIAPFKGVIAAIKVFKEQGIKGIGDAAKAFADEMKGGVAFRQNFQAGQAFADAIISGARSKKEDVQAAGEDLGQSAREGVMKEMKALHDDIISQIDDDIADILRKEDEVNRAAAKLAGETLQGIDKAAAHRLEMNAILVEDERERAEQAYQIGLEANERKMELLDQFMQEAMDRGDLDTYLSLEQERADLEVEMETNAIREKMRLRKEDLKDAEKNVKAQRDLLKGVASATSSILGTIADLYESDEKNSEKNANRIKNLRIAAAGIDTISGAIGAYMQASKTLPPPYGQIVGAAAAAAVTASGLANIAKMKATRVSGNSDTSGTVTPAVMAAPALQTEVSNVRSVTSASEEDRLNQMASSQRVYILSSDIEASQRQIRTQVAESSF